MTENSLPSQDSLADLIELEKYINDIWHFLPIPIAYVTPLGVVVDIDDAFERLVDYPREEIVGRNLNSLCAPSDMMDLLKAAVLQDRREPAKDCELHHRNGAAVPVGLTALARQDESGQTVGFFVAFFDLSERETGERALRSSEAKYRAVVEQSVDNIFIVDLSSQKIIEANTAMCKLLGYSPEEIRRLTLYDFIAHPREDIDEKIAKIVADGSATLAERQYRRKDGSLVNVEVGAALVSYGTHRAISVVSRDITETRRVHYELKASYLKLEKMIDGTVDAIARIAEARDPYTAGHQRRTAELARAIAQELGLPAEQIAGIHMAAVIHDIGKIHIPAEILVKPTQLTAVEFDIVKTHAEIGHDILKSVEFPWPVASIILQHHERMNGSGYPRGNTGTEITIDAKVLAIADVVEAMSSYRPYRPARGIPVTLEELEKNRGILYDPEVVDACLRLFRDKGFRLA